MSTAYQGRGRGGRGSTFTPGRGRGRGRQNSESKEGSRVKEAEIKFNPYGSYGGKVHATYDTVKDHILQQIQKSYKYGEDVVTSL